MLASKFYDDFYASNVFYSQLGMVNLAELNLMELSLCTALDWKLFVPCGCTLFQFLGKQLMRFSYEIATKRFLMKIKPASAATKNA